MDIQYRSYYTGFKIGANVYGGVKMSTNNIVKGNDGETRDRGNYQVNPLYMEHRLHFRTTVSACLLKKISVTSLKTVISKMIKH